MVNSGLLWVGTLKTQKHTKNDSAITLQYFYAKSARKHISCSTNDTILKSDKNGHFAKSIVKAKRSEMADFLLIDFSSSVSTLSQVFDLIIIKCCE